MADENWVQIGKVQGFYRGSYDPYFSYDKLDKTTFHNAVWEAKQPCLGIEPNTINNDYWTKLIEYEVDSTFNQLSWNPVQNKVITEKIQELEGSLGVTKYNDLTGKPKINGVELNGEMTFETLGISQLTEEETRTLFNFETE